MVENSFINYFNKETEIYKGMKLIDKKAWWDNAFKYYFKFPKKVSDEEIDDDWGENETDDSKYWFTRDKIDRITEVHDYLNNMNSVGKVISFASIVELLKI